MKHKICPRISETMTFVGLKIPESMFRDVEKLARAHMQTRSEVIRSLMLAALRAEGRALTAEEMAEVAA